MTEANLTGLQDGLDRRPQLSWRRSKEPAAQIDGCRFERREAPKYRTRLISRVLSAKIYDGDWPSGKAAGFGPVIRGFESLIPSQ